MKASLSRICLAVLLAFAVTPALHAAQTEVSDMDDDLRAKVAKHKAKKANATRSTRGSSAERQNQGDCGAMDIGNSVGSKPGKAPKEITVVITGDVINAADCNK